MQPRTLSLEQLQIPSPCHADWDQMTGDARRRFCGRCGKHVHNLSQMTQDEAAALLERDRSTHNLCVQFQYDEAGDVITLDYAPRAKQAPRWRRWAPVAAVIAAVSTLLAFVGARPGPTPAGMLAGAIRRPPVVTRPVIMGDVAPTTRPAPPPTAAPPTAALPNTAVPPGTKATCPSDQTPP